MLNPVPDGLHHGYQAVSGWAIISENDRRRIFQAWLSNDGNLSGSWAHCQNQRPPGSIISRDE
jgi:hypothetical protein